jgi:hypothetical protein
MPLNSKREMIKIAVLWVLWIALVAAVVLAAVLAWQGIMSYDV